MNTHKISILTRYCNISSTYILTNVDYNYTLLNAYDMRSQYLHLQYVLLREVEETKYT